MLILICCEGSVDEDKVEIVDNNENNNNYYYVVSNSKSDDEANKDFFEEQVDKKNQSDPQDLAQSKSGASYEKLASCVQEWCQQNCQAICLKEREKENLNFLIDLSTIAMVAKDTKSIKSIKP